MLQLLFRIWSSSVAIFFPYFDSTGVFRSGVTGVQRIEREAKRCLLLNLTFFLEPRFRIQLLQAVLRWLRSSQEYAATRNEMSRLLQTRSIVGKNLPSRGIARLLMACGQFSMSYETFSTHRSSWNLDLQPLIAKLSFFKRLGPSRGARLVAQMTRLRRGEDFSLEDVSLSCLGLTEGDLAGGQILPSLSQTVLVIGPGPVTNFPNPTNFSESIVLVTSNTSPSQVLERIEKFKASILINGEMGDLFLKGDVTPEWKCVLSKAKTVFAREQHYQRLRAKLGPKIEPYPTHISQFWLGAGGPNLLPLAIGSVLTKRHRVWVEGANLYVADVLYQKDDGTLQDKGEKGEVEFVTCLAQSNHNSVLNFALLKALERCNLIIGGNDFLQILSTDLRTYLGRLDQSLGAARK